MQEKLSIPTRGEIQEDFKNSSNSVLTKRQLKPFYPILAMYRLYDEDAYKTIVVLLQNSFFAVGKNYTTLEKKIGSKDQNNEIEALNNALKNIAAQVEKKKFDYTPLALQGILLNENLSNTFVPIAESVFKETYPDDYATHKKNQSASADDKAYKALADALLPALTTQAFTEKTIEKRERFSLNNDESLKEDMKRIIKQFFPLSLPKLDNGETDLTLIKDALVKSGVLTLAKKDKASYQIKINKELYKESYNELYTKTTSCLLADHILQACFDKNYKNQWKNDAEAFQALKTTYDIIHNTLANHLSEKACHALHQKSGRMERVAKQIASNLQKNGAIDKNGGVDTTLLKETLRLYTTQYNKNVNTERLAARNRLELCGKGLRSFKKRLNTNNDSEKGIHL